MPLSEWRSTRVCCRGSSLLGNSGFGFKNRPDDLASIIYTSGITGTLKGVQLTHGNLTSNVLNSLHGFDVHPGDVSISFLPLSHVTARHAVIALLHGGVTLAYRSPSSSCFNPS
jgi:long-subunit acyl-CoA synthetase (AMP-forming)